VVDAGIPPTSDVIAERFGISRGDALGVLRSLGAERKVILDKTSGEVWMCGPFSAVPTRFRVHGPSATWWANCAWDMLGIPASLGVSARVETSCACCDEPATIEVDAERGPLGGEGLVHILVPARQWYDDIGFT
jgi:hypothetical protein